MPAQYIPSTNEQQNNSTDTLQLLLLLKRQALEQKIAEHKLNVLGPLEDEFAKTNLDIAKFKLGEMKDTAPITKQREQVGLRRDTALAQGAEFDTQHAPELFALQKSATEARIGSEKSQQETADVTRRAQEQLIGQREKSFPVDQQSALLAQDATRQQIAASQAQVTNLGEQRKQQKQELSLQKQQLVLHAVQSREGIMLLKNNPDMARDPELSAYVKALPDDVDPKSTDEFRARYLHNVLLSNDPQLADLKYEIINNLADSVGTGRGDKAQELAKIMGVGGATDVAKSNLANAVGQAYKQTRTQGPPQDTVQGTGGENVQGDVFSTQPSTLKKGELGPEQNTPALGTVSAAAKTPSNDLMARTKYHLSQKGRGANTVLSDPDTGDLELVKRYRETITNTPIDDRSGLMLHTDPFGNATGELKHSKVKNPSYTYGELEHFTDASDPVQSATAGQISAFSSMLSEAATQEHPEQVIAKWLREFTFNPQQIAKLDKLAREVGWNVKAILSAVKTVKGE